MVTKSHLHARTSPIPGVVVIILAVAAVLFGVGVVKGRGRADGLAATVNRLEESLAVQAKERARLEQRTAQCARDCEEALMRMQDEIDELTERAVWSPGTPSSETRCIAPED